MALDCILPVDMKGDYLSPSQIAPTELHPNVLPSQNLHSLQFRGNWLAYVKRISTSKNLTNILHLLGSKTMMAELLAPLLLKLVVSGKEHPSRLVSACIKRLGFDNKLV